MSHPSASFSATLRVRLENVPGVVASVAQVIADAGGVIDAIDLVRAEPDTKVRDITVLAGDAVHLERIAGAVRRVRGVEVEHLSDRTFLMHLGGKLEVRSKVPLRARDDLSMAYTPGVARVCEAIALDPETVWNLTVKRNAVAIVSDGTAVLGLGDIGPEAALPVMEGKAMLFKEFAGVNAWPLCLATKDPDEIVATVTAIAPVFGGINLEDISAPRCFEIERRLDDTLDVPVFHDDQHGTAIVVLAALLNALRVVNKTLDEVRVVITGVGAAGVATTDMLLAVGVRDVVGCDRLGAVYLGRPGLDGVKAAYAERTNPRRVQGTADDALAGADVFIGLSGPGVVSVAGIEAMSSNAIVFAMANPTPEVLTRRVAGEGSRDRNRTIGLPEPDQQRSRLPGNIPGRSGRPRIVDHERDEVRRRRGDRLRRAGDRARRGLHHSQRLQPRRRARRRRCDRRSRGAGRRQPKATSRVPGLRRAASQRLS